ncbi:MAG: acylphosphatase [Bacteroidota bacterium]|nr:acylphosphatase [Bacteroidota bacterium]MDP4233107.1 acylphosphatase [Bacteroidota bacterium]MDP4241748.1 acylphosphatase [Bacteroidota bacterium]MDP4287406.1 acylphosphatase [Bacteroidota bacterium]
MRIHLVVSGRVQGVGFRYFCAREAERQGITGFARNTNDGSVEIEAQGDEASLVQFVQAVTRGPRAAQVTNVVREERETQPGEIDFSVG